jgi:hypothetical protein
MHPKRRRRTTTTTTTTLPPTDPSNGAIPAQLSIFADSIDHLLQLHLQKIYASTIDHLLEVDGVVRRRKTL